MPFEQSGVADGPYDFEDRLLRAMPRLVRLTVHVPERHDLALMKTVRGDQADFTKLKAIHDRKAFDLSVLLRRYEEEMGHVVIDPRRPRGNFLPSSRAYSRRPPLSSRRRSSARIRGASSMLSWRRRPASRSAAAHCGVLPGEG